MVFSINGIYKKLCDVFIDVVVEEIVPLARKHCAMRDCTPPTKKVNQPFAFWEELYNNICNSAFVALVWDTIMCLKFFYVIKLFRLLFAFSKNFLWHFKACEVNVEVHFLQNIKLAVDEFHVPLG